MVTVKGSEVPIGLYTYDTLQDQHFPNNEHMLAKYGYQLDTSAAVFESNRRRKLGVSVKLTSAMPLSGLGSVVGNQAAATLRPTDVLDQYGESSLGALASSNKFTSYAVAGSASHRHCALAGDAVEIDASFADLHAFGSRSPLDRRCSPSAHKRARVTSPPSRLPTQTSIIDVWSPPKGPQSFRVKRDSDRSLDLSSLGESDAKGRRSSGSKRRSYNGSQERRSLNSQERRSLNSQERRSVGSYLRDDSDKSPNSKKSSGKSPKPSIFFSHAETSAKGLALAEADSRVMLFRSHDPGSPTVAAKSRRRMSLGWGEPAAVSLAPLELSEYLGGDGASPVHSSSPSRRSPTSMMSRVASFRSRSRSNAGSDLSNMDDSQGAESPTDSRGKNRPKSSLANILPRMLTSSRNEPVLASPTAGANSSPGPRVRLRTGSASVRFKNETTKAAPGHIDESANQSFSLSSPKASAALTRLADPSSSNKSVRAHSHADISSADSKKRPQSVGNASLLGRRTGSYLAIKPIHSEDPVEDGVGSDFDALSVADDYDEDDDDEFKPNSAHSSFGSKSQGAPSTHSQRLQKSFLLSWASSAFHSTEGQLQVSESGDGPDTARSASVDHHSRISEQLGASRGSFLSRTINRLKSSQHDSGSNDASEPGIRSSVSRSFNLLDKSRGSFLSRSQSNYGAFLPPAPTSLTPEVLTPGPSAEGMPPPRSAVSGKTDPRASRSPLMRNFSGKNDRADLRQSAGGRLSRNITLDDSLPPPLKPHTSIRHTIDQTLGATQPIVPKSPMPASINKTFNFLSQSFLGTLLTYFPLNFSLCFPLIRL